jgi:uncharacterized protein YgfB (UPF0149 family)
MAAHHETVNTATTEATKAAEIANRQRVNEIFAQEHNGFILTDEMLLDVPPRIAGKLSQGADYTTWLNEVYTFLNKGKAVANPSVDNVANLNTAVGTPDPQKDGVDYAELANNDELF